MSREKSFIKRVIIGAGNTSYEGWIATQEEELNLLNIEDYYKSKTSPNKDYSNLAGAEIVRYENLDEYRIWNHVKAVNIEEPGGRLRGNIQYKDD